MAGKVSVREKGRGDLVTSADIASQEAIRETLLTAFPAHTFLGEESTVGPDPTADFRWIVDPLDGTSNYVHGLEFYAVSIGLEHRGELVAGVIYDPAAARCFKATTGGGAFLNDTPIRVSRVDALRSALLVTGFPPGMRGRADLLRLFEEFCSESHSVRRLGSAALDLAYVACGRFDGFYAPNLHPWDAAAGAVIVREAGGLVTNLDGSPYTLYTHDILATNGCIHQAMVDVSNRIHKI
jgi:myo-inositol-1(or 4)-monophosphatase